MDIESLGHILLNQILFVQKGFIFPGVTSITMTTAMTAISQYNAIFRVCSGPHRGDQSHDADNLDVRLAVNADNGFLMKRGLWRAPRQRRKLSRGIDAQRYDNRCPEG